MNFLCKIITCGARDLLADSVLTNKRHGCCNLNKNPFRMLIPLLLLPGSVFASVTYDSTLQVRSTVLPVSNNTYYLQNGGTYDVAASGSKGCFLDNPGAYRPDQIDAYYLKLRSYMGNPTYMTNTVVQDDFGIGSTVGHRTDWAMQYGKWVPSGDEWKENGIGVIKYGGQQVTFPTQFDKPLTRRTGTVKIRLCRAGEGEIIATAYYAAAVTPRLTAANSSISLSAELAQREKRSFTLNAEGVRPSEISFTSPQAETNDSYNLYLPNKVTFGNPGDLQGQTVEFEVAVEGVRPGSYTIPVTATALYP